MLTIKKNDFKLRFYPSNVSASYWYDPTILEKDEDFFKAYLKRGDVVIDIGANIGILTLTAAPLVSSSGMVYSVEPHPVIFNYLQKNIALNGFPNIKSINLAFGAKKETARFSDNIAADDQNRISEDGEIKIFVETLDNVFGRQLSVVNLLKIDVEGYEKFVVMGAGELLKKTECVYFESFEANFAKYNYKASELICMFQQQGFVIIQVVNNTIKYVSQSHISDKCENLVAVKDVEEFARKTNFKLEDAFQ